jgi:hypothetical protein
MIDSNSQYFYNLQLSVIFLFVDFLGIKKASTIVKAFDTCELGGSIFYDPQKVVLHKSQSPVSQALFFMPL